MTLDAAPPTLVESQAFVELGTQGWPAYSIQAGLTSLGYRDADSLALVLDGDFGARSVYALKSFQVAKALRVIDGVAGPTTKRRMTDDCAAKVDSEIPALPNKLVRVLSRVEGTDNPSAINEYDPPNSKPGTDCGIVQIRIEEPYTLEALAQAFSPVRAMRWAGARFLDKRDYYMGWGWARGNRVRAEHLALLAHNWPVGANDIAFEGKLTNPEGVAVWVAPNVYMLDGTLVNTRQEWVDYYAMGSPPHCGPAPAEIQWGV